MAILEQTYIVRMLPPSVVNLKKRLVKSPEIYLRDSGILHALLDIEEYDYLLVNPIAGTVQGMGMKYFKHLHRADGYIYTLEGGRSAS